MFVSMDDSRKVLVAKANGDDKSAPEKQNERVMSFGTVTEIAFLCRTLICSNCRATPPGTMLEFRSATLATPTPHKLC